MTSMSQPVIIPRDRHHISRRLLSPNALKILYRLRDNGFIAWLVGGCVRDLLLGREPKDFDVVTNATPGQVKKLFRNCRIIGRRFRLAHLYFNDEIIEVATFRCQAPDEEDEHLLSEGEMPRHPRHLKNEDGMVLRDNVFGTPEEDARRRDFTINALAYDIADFSIVDYVGGMDDLERGLIRSIGDPKVRFVEDPVRMIRAIRFSAMLGFEIDPTDWKALLGQADDITKAAPARLYEEIQKLFLLGAAERTWHKLTEGRLFAPLFPSVARWLAGNPRRNEPVFIKGLQWIDRCVAKGERPSPPLFLALMFGSYVLDHFERLLEDGAQHQEALNAAVALFMEETSPTVRIPGKIVMLMRDILAFQGRLRKTPGRNPAGFVSRPAFVDALAYLEYRAAEDREMEKLLGWWRRFLADHPSGEQQQDGGEKRSRSRRRRRGKRKPEASVLKT